MKCKQCKCEIADDSIFCNKCGKKQISEPRKHRRRPNRSGTVYKLSGKRARPWVAAKDGVIIDYFKTYAEADAALAKINDKEITDRYNMTFTEVFEAWKAEHYRDLTDTGEEGYETAYKHFSDLYELRFRTLKTSNYQKVIDARISAGKSRSSTDKDRQLIGQMCKWAMREEIITINYAQFIKLQENKKAEKAIFTDVEIKKIENKAKTNEAAKLIVMLLSTGMRIGELFSLQVNDIYDKHCIGGEKTEAGRNRVIPIRAEGREYFQYFKNKAPKDGLLIDGYEGNRTAENYRKREYYSLLEELCIEKKTPHATRHTYASRARKEGMPPEILQKILGHAKYSTTAEIYIHSDIDMLIQAVEPSDKKPDSKKKNPVLAI